MTTRAIVAWNSSFSMPRRTREGALGRAEEAAALSPDLEQDGAHEAGWR